MDYLNQIQMNLFSNQRRNLHIIKNKKKNQLDKYINKRKKRNNKNYKNNNNLKMLTKMLNRMNNKTNLKDNKILNRN